jgi:hypothetical protein
LAEIAENFDHNIDPWMVLRLAEFLFEKVLIVIPADEPTWIVARINIYILLSWKS